MKVTDKMLNDFFEIMDNNNEFLFGTEEDIKKQLETCLNTQGYWSGNSIRVYYDNGFYVENRF